MGNSSGSYTQEMMLGAMTNRARIQEGMYYSGINQLELVIDVDMMIKEAKLTDKQVKVVQLYYFQQYTQDEVAKVMGTSQQAVLDHLKKVKLKLNKVIERWSLEDAKKH